VTPMLVTPTKGNNRMAMGTLRCVRHYLQPAAYPMPTGFAVALVLVQILSAIARVEQKMEEKMAILEVQMMEGMRVLATDKNDREAGMTAWLLVDTEEREKRLAIELLVVNTIKMELVQKTQWELKQWKDLAHIYEERRRDIG